MIFFILFFIAYSLCVFLIPNIYILLGFATFNLLMLIIFRVNIIKTLKNLYKILFFAAFVFLFNLIFDSVLSSLIVGFKILIVTNFAFIFSYIFSRTQIATGIGQLLYPLKLFKINTDNLVIVIVIALNFIPILAEEIKTLKCNLKIRNIKLNLKTLFTKSHIILTMFFAGLLKKADDLETVLLTRNYQA